MANYVKINQISKKQIIEGLKQYEAQNWNIDTVVDNKAPVQLPVNTWNNINIDDISKITGDWEYIMWNPDAEITFIEYSDLECPFCKKLHDEWTIDKILEEYDWKVNFIFKQFPLSFHKNAPMEAEAALCWWDLAWSDKYYEFIELIFKNSKTNGTSYDINSISELWSTIWIDKTELLTCINSWKFKQKAQDQVNEWSKLFGITGTPGNVLINNKTWNWDKLPWAYPYEAFKQKLDILLK